MIYQWFLKTRVRRLLALSFFMLLCLASAVGFFALSVIAFNAVGVGALSVPFAFGFVVLFEAVRYFFYRGFFLQQMARLVAWKNPLEFEGRGNG